MKLLRRKWREIGDGNGKWCFGSKEGGRSFRTFLYYTEICQKYRTIVIIYIYIYTATTCNINNNKLYTNLRMKLNFWWECDVHLLFSKKLVALVYQLLGNLGLHFHPLILTSPCLSHHHTQYPVVLEKYSKKDE